jgi:hypothetical protein
MTLTDLRRVGNGRADAEGTPDKSIQSVSQGPLIVCNLLDPAPNKTEAEAVLESFDDQHFQVSGIIFV